MQDNWREALRIELESKRDELTARLERITANVRRGLDSDSEERAKDDVSQLEDVDRSLFHNSASLMHTSVERAMS